MKETGRKVRLEEPDLWKRLKVESYSRGKTIKQQLKEIIAEWLKRAGKGRNHDKP